MVSVASEQKCCEILFNFIVSSRCLHTVVTKASIFSAKYVNEQVK